LILFLTLLLISVRCVYAGNAGVHVTVFDSNNNPVPGALVEIEAIERGTVIGYSEHLTDNNGYCQFAVGIFGADGIFNITVSKEGYKTVEVTVTVTEGKFKVHIQLLKEGESGEGGVVFVTGAICGLDGWDDIPDMWVNVPNFWTDPIGAIIYGGVNAILWLANNVIEIIFDIFKMLFGWFHNLFMGLANLLQGWGIAAPFALAISFMVIFGVLAIFFRILWWIYDKIPII